MRAGKAVYAGEFMTREITVERVLSHEEISLAGLAALPCTMEWLRRMAFREAEGTGWVDVRVRLVATWCRLDWRQPRATVIRQQYEIRSL